MAVFAVSVFDCLAAKNKRVGELHLRGLATGISEIEIVIRLLPFLCKVVYNVENSKAEVCLSGAVGAIDNAIFDDVILNGIGAETVVAVLG